MTGGDVQHLDAPGSRDADLLLALLLGAVAYLTLRPFNPADNLESVLAGLRGIVLNPADPLTPVHAVPAAVGVMLLRLASPSMRPARAVGVVLLALAALELGQAGIQFRHARGGDLLAQALGAWIGLKLIAAAPDRCAALAAKPRLWRAAWAGILAAAVLFAAWSGVRAQFGHAIGPLEETYRLTVGNEVGGERPWLGTIHGVAIIAAGADDQTAAELARSRIGPGHLGLRTGLGTATVYDFIHTGAEIGGIVRVPDAAGLSDDLWRRGVELTTHGFETAGDLMATRRAVTGLSRAIESAGAVLVEADLTPAATEQRGPARIVTISNGPAVRSVTLAQLGDAAVLRVRTPRTGQNASRVAVSFPGVFSAGERVHLLAEGTGGRIRLWRNGLFVGERFLMVTPGDWLRLRTAAGDGLASLVLFAPIGLAAAGVFRHRLPAMLAGAIAGAAAVGPVALAAGLEARPIPLGAVVMAPSLACLAAAAGQLALERRETTEAS
ncbi:MAG: hypothetical protein AAGF47_07265 [Planctomycetota bacterium]